MDLLRIILVADVMGHEHCLSRDTVDSYLSHVKHFYLTDLSLPQPPSRAWGAKGERHPLLRQTIQAIPEAIHKPQIFLTSKWIKHGFEHCWSETEYVAIAFLYGWILRAGEGCKPLEDHILTWSMVKFYVVDEEGSEMTLPFSKLTEHICDMVRIFPESRKYQSHSRPLPGRVNKTHLKNPAAGTTTWCNLCMPTLLQGWAIRNKIHTMSRLELLHRPILTDPITQKVVTASQVSTALRRNARALHEDESAVIPRCLRRTPITQLANSNLVQSPSLLLLATGHKDLRSTAPYIDPGYYMAEKVTNALATSKYYPTSQS